MGTVLYSNQNVVNKTSLGMIEDYKVTLSVNNNTVLI